MHTLNHSECREISGGLFEGQLAIAAIATIPGSIIGYKAMQYLEPISTTFGIVTAGVSCGLIGFACGGPVGSIVCASAAMGAAYFTSSTLANVFIGAGGGAVIAAGAVLLL